MIDPTGAVNANAVHGLRGIVSPDQGSAAPRAEPAALQDATHLARQAFAPEASHAAAVNTTSSAQGGQSFLAKLDHMDRQFLNSIEKTPELNLADAATPEGMMKLSMQLLDHQAGLARATIGISMVSSGTTSFRDGVKQVLTTS